jgi:WD40 repeat protein
MASEPPKVFISYSHDSPEHEERVLALAERLRADGVDAQLDQYLAGTPREGWGSWLLDQLDCAEFVLVVCTETYRRSWGHEEPDTLVGWESSLITLELYQYEAQKDISRFVPVLFDHQDEPFIPEHLSGHIHYLLSSEDNYIKLYNLLRGEAGSVPAKLSPLTTAADRALGPPTFGNAEAAGELHDVPDLPPHYLPLAQDLARLKNKLRDGGGTVGITGQSSAVGVQGTGGIGKTVLATALAHDPKTRQAFPDGIYWLTVGQKPKLLQLQNQLLSQLTGSKQGLLTEQETKDALRKAFEGRRVLVILDDVWTFDDASTLSVNTRPARLLLTTRNQEVLVGIAAEEHCVEVLLPRDALKILGEWVGERDVDKLPSAAAKVAKECGYLPLALAMMGAMVRRSNHPAAIAWQDALDCLHASDLEEIKRSFPGYPYPNLLRALDASVEALDDPDQQRYLDLAVFPEDHPVPETALRVLWKLNGRHTRACMARLAERSLARIGRDSTLVLHDLQRDLIGKRREMELPRLHLGFLEAWDASHEPQGDYMWRWVAYHLMSAGRRDDLRQLLLNFDYLQGKLAATDTNALIADYDYFGADEELRLIQLSIQLSGHILVRDIGQLAGQLLGRLLNNSMANIQVFLNQTAAKKAGPWLRPMKPSLSQPGGHLIRILRGHKQNINAVVLTPDNRSAVSGSWDNTLRVWNLENGKTLHTLEGHPNGITAVAITSDGRRIASGSNDSTLRVWDLESGETLRTLKGHLAWIRGVAITPDGRHAVSASEDRTLRVWDLENGRTLRSLKGHESKVTAVAITSDGRRIVSGSDDSTLRVWDLESGQTLRTLTGHDSEITAVAITSDGRRIVSGSYNGTLRLWDLRTGQMLRTLERHAGMVHAVAVTPDGHRAVSASEDMTLRVWDLESGQTIRTLEGHLGSVRGVAITSDACRAVSASDDVTLRVWDLEGGQTVCTLKDHTDQVRAVARSSLGQLTVSASYDGTVRVWNLQSGLTIRTLQGHTRGVIAVAMTPDGRRVVSGSLDRTLRLWDLGADQTIRMFQGHTDWVNVVAITSDGQHIVSGSEDGTLRVWELESGRTLHTLEGHKGSVTAVAITSDGHRAVSASADCTLRIWDLESGQTLRILEGHFKYVRDVAITPDGRRAVSASTDYTLRVWDLDSGRTLRTLEGHRDWVNVVAIMSDGRRALSGSDDGTIRMWDLESGRTLYTFEGHKRRVTAVAITSDGRRAVSTSADHTLWLWDLEYGKKVATFVGESPITDCVFAANDRTIVAGDELGRVHLLRLVEADPTKPPKGETRIPLLLRQQKSTDKTETPSMPQSTRDQVFVSYSHKDKKWLEKFQTMLKPLVRNRTISVWDDTTIPVGGKWKEQIDVALAVAKVAVLLVSPNFLESDFIAKHELPPILNAAAQDGLVIFWVYVSSCVYQATEIKDYQAAHDISKPLDSLTPAKRNAVLAAVCRKIEAVAKP